MKKRIVYILCEIGLIGIAERISVSIVCKWRGEKIAEGWKRGLNETREQAEDMAVLMLSLKEKLDKAVNLHTKSH